MSSNPDTPFVTHANPVPWHATLSLSTIGIITYRTKPPIAPIAKPRNSTVRPTSIKCPCTMGDTWRYRAATVLTGWSGRQAWWMCAASGQVATRGSGWGDECGQIIRSWLAFWKNFRHPQAKICMYHYIYSTRVTVSKQCLLFAITTCNVCGTK